MPTPVEKIEHALRVERDTLRAQGNMHAANAIATYMSQADGDSKQRFHDIIMGLPVGHGFSQEDIWHEARHLGVDDATALRSLIADEEARRDD